MSVRLDFFLDNIIEDWTCLKVIDFYRKKVNQKKVLGFIHKDLRDITNFELGFDATRKNKAQEILDNWKNWTASVRNFKKARARIKVDLMKVKQINQFSTGNGATYNDNRKGKHRQDVDDNEKKIIPAKKCKATSEKRTRSGRVAVPDYRELFESTNVGTSSKENEDPSKVNEEDVTIGCSFENPSQENEEESTTEHSFENPSQENEEAATVENSSQDNEEEATTEYSFESIQDEIITDTLGNDKRSDATKEIVKIYKSKCPNGDLIDLRLKSPFLKQLSEQVATSYLKEMDDLTESLVPKNVHAFLVKFFSQNLTTEEWNRQIDDLRAPVKDDFIMNAVVRVLRRTLPQFIKAFSLEEQNPLFNIATLEHAHLNAFVHPCLDAFLWYIAGVHYEYGEFTSKNHTNGNRADGVGYMTDADNYQLVYVEGSRPITKDKKEIDDVKIIPDNLKNIFAKIVKETIESRQRLPEKLCVFGGQSFRLRIYLYFLDYCGTYRLNEIDNAILPRKFSEMKKFVYFYECVLKWALLVRDVTESFVDAGVEQRPSRLSYVNALLQLD
ncbi:hypothetical protein F8M41_025244 [Gigaspora margarita]|uniref:Uncharacterized protein n=1 Tax=Gigaspora margarita TaxID=4874 RepID=A0A8H3XL23_GIGMA|nr:hypothetical protein F8M41_025244 [Gigaspora margarita]